MDNINEIQRKLEDYLPSPVLQKEGLQTLSEDFIPDKPIHRDRHILELGKRIKEFLEFNTIGTIFLEGSPGTGKTMCFLIVKKILENLISSKKLRGEIVYVKGREKTVHRILREILRNIGISIGEKTSFGEAISILEDETSKKPIHVCIDEVDLIRTYKTGGYCSPSVEDLLYYFSRTPNLSVTIITNNFRFIETLSDARVKSSITKDRTIFFENYTFEQLVDIFQYRISLAFRKGAVPDNMIEKLARIVYETTGDVRHGLEVLRYAAIICTNWGKEVVDDTVLEAAIELRRTKEMINKILGLSLTHRAILASYYLNFRKSGKKEQTTQEMYEIYQELMENSKKTVVDLNTFRNKVLDLVTMNLLEQTKIGKGRGKGVDKLYTVGIPTVTLNEAIMSDPDLSESVKSLVRDMINKRIERVRYFQ
ncbi:MAG: hypothetical protein QXN49_07255 [Archaeoglobaceae archaeon]